MLTVGSIMTRKLVTVPPECPVERARALMREHGVRHLPVVDHQRLVGVLSERDLMERSLPEPRRKGEPAPHEGEVRDHMSVAVETATPDESVTDACRRMLERRISCLPVLRDGRLAGILSELDLLRLYGRVMRYSGHDPALDPPIDGQTARPLVLVAPGATAAEAFELCRTHGIRHLPVVHDGWLVGVISQRDLFPVIGRAEGELRKVSELMTLDFVTIAPGAPMSKAAEHMLANGFHALPVLVNGALRGIVTSADVLAVLDRIDERELEAAWSGEVALKVEAEES